MREITMEDELLVLTQSAIENIARVVDKHGDLNAGDDPDAMYYSLEIAIEQLYAAEKILEAGPPPVDLSQIINDPKSPFYGLVEQEKT